MIIIKKIKYGSQQLFHDFRTKISGNLLVRPLFLTAFDLSSPRGVSIICRVRPRWVSVICRDWISTFWGDNSQHISAMCRFRNPVLDIVRDDIVNLPRRLLGLSDITLVFDKPPPSFHCFLSLSLVVVG